MSWGKGVIPAQTNRLFLAGPHSGQTTTHSHSHHLIAFGLLIVFGLIMKDFRSLIIQSLDCGRKPKHLDGTHKDKCGKHTNLHRKRSQSPKIPTCNLPTHSSASDDDLPGLPIGRSKSYPRAASVFLRNCHPVHHSPTTQAIDYLH